MELDIFVPNLDLGIEYQGEQHYRPIDFFDGDKPIAAQKSFLDRVSRDQEKTCRVQSYRDQASRIQILRMGWLSS